jgi:hypothetical protein
MRAKDALIPPLQETLNIRFGPAHDRVLDRLAKQPVIELTVAAGSAVDQLGGPNKMILKK